MVGAGGRRAASSGVGVVGGGVPSSPKKRITCAASTGRLCVTPCMLIASTGAIGPLLPYRVRV